MQNGGLKLNISLNLQPEELQLQNTHDSGCKAQEAMNPYRGNLRLSHNHESLDEIECLERFGCWWTGSLVLRYTGWPTLWQNKHGAEERAAKKTETRSACSLSSGPRHQRQADETSSASKFDSLPEQYPRTRSEALAQRASAEHCTWEERC